MPDSWLVLTRTLHYAALMQLLGVFVFLRLVQPEASPRLRRRLRGLAWASLALAVLSAFGWLALEAAAMSGDPLRLIAADGALGTVWRETRFGVNTQIRAALALAAALALLLPGRERRWREGLLMLLGAAMLGGVAWVGHGAAVPGRLGDLHLADDVLHLIAAGCWIGALLPLTLCLAEARGGAEAATAGPAVRRFSRLGYGTVGTVLASGLVNAWFMVGSPALLVGTLYGRLLLGKITLFLVMVALAAVNRLWLAPRLGRSPAGAAALQRNCLLELGLGLAILAIVGLLGLLAPATHAMAG